MTFEASKDMCMLAFDRLSTELGDISYPVPEDVLRALDADVGAAGDRGQGRKGEGAAAGGWVSSLFSLSGASPRASDGRKGRRNSKRLPPALLLKLYGVDASKSCPLFVTWEKTDAATAAAEAGKGGGGGGGGAGASGADADADSAYELRGCIGNLSDRPLSEIEDYALTASLRVSSCLLVSLPETRERGVELTGPHFSLLPARFPLSSPLQFARRTDASNPSVAPSCRSSASVSRYSPTTRSASLGTGQTGKLIHMESSSPSPAKPRNSRTARRISPAWCKSSAGRKPRDSVASSARRGLQRPRH